MIHLTTRLSRSPSLIDLTPLVDVIFLLLIFFVVTSDILPLKSLHLTPPSIDKEANPLTSQLVVAVDAEQVIYVGSKKHIVALSEVKEVLEREWTLLARKGSPIQPTIVLSIDKRTPYELFLPLFSQTQELGYPIRLVFQQQEEGTLCA